jgi:peptidoglycan/LPS O-acetylase OafA/YrhL
LAAFAFAPARRRRSAIARSFRVAAQTSACRAFGSGDSVLGLTVHQRLHGRAVAFLGGSHQRCIARAGGKRAPAQTIEPTSAATIVVFVFIALSALIQEWIRAGLKTRPYSRVKRTPR